MKKILVSIVFLSVMLTGCKDKYSPDTYYSSTERDSVLTDIITYIYSRPNGATWETRFDPQFRNFYAGQLKKFQFEHYFITENGIHYFYLIRPARATTGTHRGVGGCFKLDSQGQIISFEEKFDTPARDVKELQEKGKEMFLWMVKTGNVNDYVKNPDYIEWPNKMTYYDTIQHEWLVKPGI